MAALAAALEQEHRDIDRGIETFLEQLDHGAAQPDALNAALDALRRHIYLEEEFLFPPLRAAGMLMPILVMLREHGELWRTMTAVSQLAADGASAELRTACAQLLSQLAEHNAKEEPIVYSRADIDLPVGDITVLDEFIETGRTPDGWVCQQARRV